MDKAKIESVCMELKGAFSGIVLWKWDSRFGTILSEFSTDNKDSVRKVLTQYFNIVWDNTVINKAPDIVRTINNHLGGLMPGQIFFTSDINQDIFIFCAWWPWGNGKTISIRIAPYFMKLSDSEKAEYMIVLKKLFGL